METRGEANIGYLAQSAKSSKKQRNKASIAVMVDEHVRKDLDLAVPAVTPEVEEKILHSVGTDRAGRQKSTESILLLKLVSLTKRSRKDLNSASRHQY
ncbi:hypothetical protein VTN31DRAFT_552 [Thermomyces dupontii]|uniref:uncharacterized protein n=1 Tax=Talaromyces thermophilus TaxID=28565 RepID=UPI0037438ACE